MGKEFLIFCNFFFFLHFTWRNYRYTSVGTGFLLDATGLTEKSFSNRFCFPNNVPVEN